MAKRWQYKYISIGKSNSPTARLERNSQKRKFAFHNSTSPEQT
jgi:hypothetical protein